MSLIPERRPEDILSGVARVTLAGTEYRLPPLFWDANEEWNASLDGRLRGLLGALEAAGDDYGALLTHLTSEPTALLDALVAYDYSGVLPDKATIRASCSINEVLVAVLGVWRAANPLVDAAILGLNEWTASTLSAVLSGLQGPTDGVPATSEDTSPPNNLSPSSMSPTSGKRTSSNGKSRRSASATSSPTTRRPRSGGGPARSQAAAEQPAVAH